MTITVKTPLPGRAEFARRNPPTASANDPRMPVTTDITLADATNKGNTLLGRREQIAVIDTLHAQGVVDQANLLFVGLQERDYDDDATVANIMFALAGYNSATHTRRTINWEIRKLGLVSMCDETRSGVGAALGGQSYPRQINQIQYVFSGARSESLDLALGTRYLSRTGAATHGLRPGNWTATFPLAGGVTALLAAPGAGLHYRIRTLIVIANGGTTASHRLTLGTGATPASAILQEWYSSPAGDGFRVQSFLTDRDIPVPENTAVGLNLDSDFALRTSVIIGAEVCKVANHNFLNLTGVPQ